MEARAEAASRTGCSAGAGKSGTGARKTEQDFREGQANHFVLKYSGAAQPELASEILRVLEIHFDRNQRDAELHAAGTHRRNFVYRPTIRGHYARSCMGRRDQ